MIAVVDMEVGGVGVEFVFATEVKFADTKFPWELACAGPLT